MKIDNELTAEFVKEGRGNSHANWKLYKLSHPVATESWNAEQNAPFEYVCVSASNVPYSGPETYVFAADVDGNITDWGELDGSFRGALDFEQALNGFIAAHNE